MIWLRFWREFEQKVTKGTKAVWTREESDERRRTRDQGRIMSGAALKLDERYCWADYCGWPDDERWEIIGGVAFDMSPAPVIRHQAIVVELGRQFANAFLDKKCRVFVAPADVKLSEEDIVEPDVFVVCETERIKRTHIEGAPTLVIEVLSPSTAKKDRTLKMDLYAVSGVKEYWVVEPDVSTVEVFELVDGAYRLAGKHGAGDAAESVVFSGLSVDLKSVFGEWGRTLNDERGTMNGSGELLLVKEDAAEYGESG